MEEQTQFACKTQNGWRKLCQKQRACESYYALDDTPTNRGVVSNPRGTLYEREREETERDTRSKGMRYNRSKYCMKTG